MLKNLETNVNYHKLIDDIFDYDQDEISPIMYKNKKTKPLGLHSAKLHSSQEALNNKYILSSKHLI